MASNRVFATIGLILAGAVAAPAAVLAAGALDQQVTGTTDGFTVYGTLMPAQVFTAGIRGELDQIDLRLSTGFGLVMPGQPAAPAEGLTVQLWTVVGGAPGNPIPGASATVPTTAVPRGSNTWVHVPFSAASVVGTQYAIVLSSPGSSGGVCPETCWNWFADSSNPYAGGGSFYRLNSPTWVAQARDLNFKTYVTRHSDLQVSLAGSGEGTVTSTPSRIDCGADCLATFVSDTLVVLTAEPLSGGTFERWEGGPCDGSTNPVCDFTMPGELTETTAVFSGITPPISAPPATAAPTPTLMTPPPSATIRPSGAPTTGPVASVAPTPGLSEAPPSPADSVLQTAAATTTVTLAPGATPGPTAAPLEPAAASGGPPIVVLLLLVAALVVAGAVVFYVLRRRRSMPPAA